MPIYLSASSINDFIRCPQKVLYRIEKTVKEIPNRDMIKGVVMHTVLEKEWRNRDSAVELLQSESKKSKLTRTEHNHLGFMLDMFFLNFRRTLKESDLVEYRFKLPLHSDVFIVGKMDRISEKSIIDWKTSSRISSRLGNDPQCIIYEWAYNKIYGENPASVLVASLSTGQWIPLMWVERATSELFVNIIRRMI